MNEIILAMCLSLGIADNCPQGMEIYMPMDVDGAYGHNKASGKPVIMVNERRNFSNGQLRNLLEHEMAHHFCQINYEDPCASHDSRFKKQLKEVRSENKIKSVEISAYRRMGDTQSHVRKLTGINRH